MGELSVSDKLLAATEEMKNLPKDWVLDAITLIITPTTFEFSVKGHKMETA